VATLRHCMLQPPRPVPGSGVRLLCTRPAPGMATRRGAARSEVRSHRWGSPFDRRSSKLCLRLKLKPPSYAAPHISYEALGYYQDPLRSVESKTQFHLNLRPDLESPRRARSNELLGTTESVHGQILCISSPLCGQVLAVSQDSRSVELDKRGHF
jgi:hypothetical protein